MLRQIYDYSVLFPWNPRTNNTMQVANATGADVTLQMGTVMGYINATKLLTPMVSTATDGSQVPVGVLANTVVIPAGSTGTNVTVFIQGDVVAGGLIFVNGTDTLQTNITLASGDIIGSIQLIMIGKGMLPIVSQDGTYYDN